MGKRSKINDARVQPVKSRRKDILQAKVHMNIYFFKVEEG